MIINKLQINFNQIIANNNMPYSRLNLTNFFLHFVHFNYIKF